VRPAKDPARAGAHTLARSFGWAWAGLTETAVRERNMRLHLALGVLAASAAALLPLGGAEQALLLLATALVVAGEVANSALEAVVDLVSPGPDPRARIAKDAAAGAVLALAAGSVVVLVAVALPAALALASRRALVPFLPGVAGAALAALAAALLPAPRPRPLLVDAALAGAAAAGLLLVARAAERRAGVGAAALLALVAVGGAVRRRRGALSPRGPAP
jgi:diacylglycerol kinase (ATP)